MRTKEWTFDEELPMPSVTLDLEYDYSFTAGKIYGPPEDCYPDEEESEISLPDGWELKVIEAYTLAAREAIKKIQYDLVPQLEWEGKPKEWAYEDNAERQDDCD